MAISLTRKLVALFTAGASAPEPSALVYAQDLGVEALNEAGLLDVEKTNTEPSDKTKIWAAAAADPMVDPGTLKLGIDGGYADATPTNFAKHICQKGGALKGIYTGNIAMNFYSSAAPGELTIPTDWVTYSWFNSYLASGTMTITGDTEVSRSGTPSITGLATSAGQAMIMAVRET